MKNRMSGTTRSYLAAGSMVVLAGTLLHWLTSWPAYAVWVATLSLVCFAVYGLDKARAGGSGRRVPESLLHWLALLGGVPGAWLGRAVFRHKTRKPIFTLILLGSTVVHGAIGCYLVLTRSSSQW